MAKSKYLAVLSASAIATLLASATTAMAADGDIYNKSNNKTPFIEKVNYAEEFDKLVEAVSDYENYLYEFNGKVYDLGEAGTRIGVETNEDAIDKILNQMAKEVKGQDLKEFKGEEALKVNSVSAITDSKLSVKLSSAIDEVNASNFKIEGMTVVSAELLEGKKEVKLGVSGAETNKAYTLQVSGLKVNGKAMENLTCEFTMPKAESLYIPEVSIKDATIKADAQASTLVTFELKDANGELMKDADNVEVAFTTTFGRLAERRVAVQNGVATVLLTSETLSSTKVADVTATIVEASNKNLIGLKANKTLVMDPNPDSVANESVGATMTEVQAAQADRVIVYFNKNIDIQDYVIPGTYKIDSNKATVTVKTKVGNDGNGGQEVDVKGILPVQGNPKAMQVLLDTESAQYLTDNSNVRVNFVDATGSLPVPSTKYCKLTDARKPAMLSVEKDGLNKLKVVFSEPVEMESATKTGNWIIDGLGLDNDVYGVLNHKAKVEIGKFEVEGEKAGEDARNVVTITLGKDTDGNQIYFKSGTHSIQGSSIGDWANKTDIGNNVMNTQTLDFDIPVDNAAPSATVEVQSPEQYIVTFNKEINQDNLQGKIKLEKYNKSTGKWEAAANQTIKVEKLDYEKVKSVQFKVEVETDWTVAYNTEENKQNYYNDNYRLVIDANEIAAAANGIKNAKIELPLEGAMKTPDVQSPKIDKIVDNEDEIGTYIVTMSEPVKLPSDVNKTVAQRQGAIPQPTAQFIKKDGSKTIGAKVESASDVYDKQLKVTPIDEKGNKIALDAGDWQVVVRSISDDIGNTAASETEEFTVKAPEKAKEGEFAIVWSFADVDADVDVDTETEGDKEHDYVYVKFNKPVSITGDAKNALKTSNYQLDGMPLPTGTQIKANIKSVDDKDTVTDSITIVLPEGYLNKKNEPHIINVSNYLESTTPGDTLSNGGAKTLTFTADVNNDIFKKELAAEKAVCALEEKVNVLVKATAVDLTKAENAGKIEAAKNALTDAKNNGFTPAKNAMEAEAVTSKGNVKFIEYTLAKASLTSRYEAAKSALEVAEAKIPVGVTLGKTNVDPKGVKKESSKPGNKQEIELKVTNAATGNGNITIDGKEIAVTSVAENDAAKVADKIAKTTFTNWDVSLKVGVTDTVVFTAKKAASDKNINAQVAATGVQLQENTTKSGKADEGEKPGTKAKATTIVTSPANRAGKITVNVSDGTLNKDIVVKLEADDTTAEKVATRIRAAITANEDISKVYTVAGAGANVELEQKEATGDVDIAVTLK